MRCVTPRKSEYFSPYHQTVPALNIRCSPTGRIKKKPAPKRGFSIEHQQGGIEGYSAARAALKVVLGRIAVLALATSGR